ncbi:flagellar filament capping protein FliD [Burkholderia thailandensis]|uniref:Flagellar hook-associated protein 2 n=2 Tax=Burkholderia thailandensis TaxID=57975 RepID=A0AAW9D215_BURTH|nr:flagellar filament capping protein FliD [Burkholderia thailandensis]ABC37544.1 flagellar hook-associated protein 2 [Burkholderia thailandensis E264]AHI64168.1 flagellar hook-associated family protein [Burkholderia thailandensis H0587]AHI72735.1 flagellar hook-associated family protein [Burkholderia thailandensis 2002721723]AHI77556.1 flagellar hook-associated family protein [Burkholderia thailandensis E444]AIC86743.1 flagellar hook-associated family protein [Burkholderia thailandensis USAMR
MSTVTGTTTTTQQQTDAALQQAAQSIISGATGNSSMDVNSLVTALVNAKTAGQSAALSTSVATDQTTLSALGTLKAALTALQAGIGSLGDGTLTQKFTATATGTGLTATTGAGAVAGSYSVAVTQIATSQTLSSGAFNATQQLGTGTLTLSVGGKSTSISIDSTNNTLSGIASAINSAPNNPGVTATIVTGTDGAHLVLRSATTGAANVINVGVSNLSGDNGLSSLAVTSTASTTGGQSTIQSGGSIAWTQSTSAQDAEFTVGGIAASSASNAVSGAIAGVTLNLTQAAVGTTQTLNVTTDTTAQATAITNVVNLYNTVVTTMSSLSSLSGAGTSSQRAGPLLGDSTLNMIQNSLARVVGAGVTTGGSTVSLASIGITFADGATSTQADGTLTIDTTKLNAALQNSPSTVAAVFNSTNGIGAQLNTTIQNYVQTGGVFDTRSNALNQDLKSLAQQQTQLASYASQLTSQYNAQFTALNTLMAQMNSNSNYLTQLFGGSNSSGAMANNK